MLSGPLGQPLPVIYSMDHLLCFEWSSSWLRWPLNGGLGQIPRADSLGSYKGNLPSCYASAHVLNCALTETSSEGCLPCLGSPFHRIGMCTSFHQLVMVRQMAITSWIVTSPSDETSITACHGLEGDQPSRNTVDRKSDGHGGSLLIIPSLRPFLIGCSLLCGFLSCTSTSRKCYFISHQRTPACDLSASTILIQPPALGSSLVK